jgi:uncharacterized protein (UPF0371 family)
VRRIIERISGNRRSTSLDGYGRNRAGFGIVDDAAPRGARRSHPALFQPLASAMGLVERDSVERVELIMRNWG